MVNKSIQQSFYCRATMILRGEPNRFDYTMTIVYVQGEEQLQQKNIAAGISGT
jgi:hypothetical protein